MKILGAISVFPPLPPPLSRLSELAYNLWWSWSPAAQQMYRTVDPVLWEQANHNPIKLLRAVDPATLAHLAEDTGFLQLYEAVLTAFDAYMNPTDTWYRHTYPDRTDEVIAYFSAEFGLHEALPIYSGGLGILSGDHCKSASDLGLPFVGVGFLYPQGYFKQRIAVDGTQEAIYEKLEFAEAPARPATDANGGEIIISVNLPGRKVYAKVWRIQVGRVPLYLMDTDVSQNRPDDRVLAARLYGGNQDLRVAQEVVLGIGGVRALRALGIHPTVTHMNEGHAAFSSLERVCGLVQEQHLSFYQAQQAVAASTVFTTHTPVPAGNDAFPFEMIDHFFHQYWGKMGLDRTGFMNLARWQTPWGERFSMTILALRFAVFANGVSQLHGRVARQMWSELWPQVPNEEIPILAITNGVHTDTWLAPEVAVLYDKYLGAEWRTETDQSAPWQGVSSIPNQELWDTHQALKRKLIDFVRERVARQRRRHGDRSVRIDAAQTQFDPNAFTIGFARRFATYKRATLLFHDLERIQRILKDSQHPVQILFAGKAHPADDPGKALIKRIHALAQTPEFEGKIVFIEDYDMNVARLLVQGVDLWLNTPRRPNEASGTSGQKAALNGIPNLSVRDGWWDEGYNGKNGWAIGEEREYRDEQTQDEADALSLYNILENEVLPAYFSESADGVHDRWVETMKEAIRSCAPRFSMCRQVKDYTVQLYLPAAVAGKQRAENHYEKAQVLAAWKERCYLAWPQVAIRSEALNADRVAVGEQLHFSAHVFLGSLSPEDVLVEFVWGWRRDGQLEDIRIVPMKMTQVLAGGLKQYECDLAFNQNGRFGYGIRIIPQHLLLIQKHELGLVKWA